MPFDLAQAAIMVMALVAVWRIQNIVPGLNAIKISYLAPALAALAFAASKDPRRSLGSIKSPLLYLLLGIVLVIVLGVPTSLWPGKSFNFLLNDHGKTILLMLLIAASIRGWVDLERYAWMHILGGAFFCAYIVTHFNLRNGRLGELIYYDANDLGLLLVCTIPLCVYFLRPRARLIEKGAALAALMLFTYTTVKTGSRGGFLGFLATGLYLLLSFTAIPKRIRLYSIGALAAGLMVFGGSQYFGIMKSITNPTEDYNWTQETGRKAIWTRGMGYMLTHPLTGVGARAFKTAEGRSEGISERQEEGKGTKWSAAHNSFVEIGAELGVTGLVLFLLALGRSWRFLRKVGSSDPTGAGRFAAFAHALAGVLVAYCVAGFFVSAGYSAYLYTIFGIILGLMKLTAEPQAVGAKPEKKRLVRRVSRVAPKPFAGGLRAPELASPVSRQGPLPSA
jgi:O-antigen ligase